jgi:hypothetical protein
VIYLTSSFSVVGLTCATNTASPSLLSHPYMPWRDIMDPSAGLRPNPTGLPTPPGATAKPARPGAASPSTGVSPHCATLPRATSGTRPTTRSSSSAAIRPNPNSSGPYDPLRDKDNDSASTSSPLLLSLQEDDTPPTGNVPADETPPTGDVPAPSSSASAVGAADVGATGTAGATATATSDSSFVTQHEMSAFSSVLLTVS